jgi:hypothetical protein
MANPLQLVTLKTAVTLRLVRNLAVHGAEDFNVTVTHVVGRVMSASQDNKVVNYRLSEVAWDKDRPVFYKLGAQFGLVGPLANGEARVDLRVDNIKSAQKIGE